MSNVKVKGQMSPNLTILWIIVTHIHIPSYINFDQHCFSSDHTYGQTKTRTMESAWTYYLFRYV